MDNLPSFIDLKVYMRNHTNKLGMATMKAVQLIKDIKEISPPRQPGEWTTISYELTNPTITKEQHIEFLETTRAVLYSSGWFSDVSVKRPLYTNTLKVSIELCEMTPQEKIEHLTLPESA